MKQELKPGQLRAVCDPAEVNCEHTDELTPLTEIIGQARAVKALQFGLGITADGFNLYIAGAPGTGKTSAATSFLEEAASSVPTPPDWVYVHNFKDPYQPRAISLPAGQGREFAADVRRIIEQIQSELPRAFESEAYTERRDQIAESLTSKRRELLSELTQYAKERGMAIQATPSGFVIIPVTDGAPVKDADIEAMDKEQRDDLMRKRDEVEARLKAVLIETRGTEREASEAIADLDREVATFAIGHLLDDLAGKYGDVDGAHSYLQDLKSDVVDSLRLFRGGDEPERSQTRDPGGRDVRFRRYEVNVIVDNSNLQGAPVISELSPTYTHLFGKIEKEAHMGALTTDFTMIRAGAAHQANGGYLVIPARELLTSMFSYDTLKLAIRSREITIEETAERLGMTSMKSLRPEPIPLDVKVVLIGDAMLHFLLRTYDPDFAELFKVKAEFGTTMDRTEENTQLYASFVCTLCEKEGLQHLSAAAVAALVEHSSRMAGDQAKLSAEFSEISDVVREADYYARQAAREWIEAQDIREGVEQRHYRSNLIEERLRELIDQGVILIDTGGEVTGQINGLSVLSLGDMSFGVPARITTTVGLGRAGVIDIEREARLGGPIHTKGVLILGGFMTERYARKAPLSLSARLVFEQSYGMIDGDSASLAETCVLLSALAEAPIRQSLAVTGSVNQKGRVQAIGGVNQKIEGFFATCCLAAGGDAAKLDGSQGVLIPGSNVRHLMLQTEVVDAVRAGRFRIWAVDTVDDALELLTGQEAGEPDESGQYPKESINGRVAARLADLAEGLRHFGAGRDTTVERPEERAQPPEPTPPQPPPVARE